MTLIIRWLLSAISIIIAAKIVPGITVNNFLTALILVIVFAIINTVIKPLIMILTLPINVLTLGLFTFIINALLILLTAQIVKGFSVESFVSALLFSIVVSILNMISSKLVK